MIIQAAPVQDIPWLANRAGIAPTLGMNAVQVVDAGGKIHGMVGFDSWTDNSVVVSIALANAGCLRSLIQPCFEYVFLTGGRGVMFATIRATNSRSVRIAQRLGFSEVYRLKDAVAVGEDMILFEMRRENCRWIPEQHRKAA